jgi:hypothetical protein
VYIIAHCSSLNTTTFSLLFSVPTDLKKEGVKYEMVGEWHRLAATGYRMIPVMPVRDGKGRYDGFDYAFWNAGVKEKEKEKEKK